MCPGMLDLYITVLTMVLEGSESLFLAGNWHCKAVAWHLPVFSLHGSELFCAVTTISTGCVDGMLLLNS